jgi:hypothetical protein
MIRHPVKRHVLNVATALSVLLCAALVALWVRSYRVADELTLKRARYDYSPSESRELEEPSWVGRISVDRILSNRGIVGGYHKRSVDPLIVDVKDWSEDYPAGRVLLWDRDEPLDRDSLQLEDSGQILHPSTLLDRLGFFVGRYQIEGMAAGMADFNVGEVQVPIWFLAALAAILPFLRAMNLWRSRRRRAPGVCQQCGYSLVGNVSGICPECGMATSETATV